MDRQREFFRIAVERRGCLRRGHEEAPCRVLDLTEKGVQLQTDLLVTVGDDLRLDVDLTETSAISCGIHVTRVSETSVGARITDIALADQAELSRFVEQLITLNLGGC